MTKREPFRKKNILEKLWLKLKDKPKYKQYKWELKNFQQEEFYNRYTGADRLTTIKKIEEAAKRNNNELNISHSGNAGDIIYALPTLKKIHELTGININFYLRIDQPMVLSIFYKHPMGNVKLNSKMAEMLLPLLQAQSYIAHCEVYTQQEVHIDLDYFHSGTIPLARGNIARWCSYITGVSPELWKPWIYAEPDKSYADSTIIARSERYRNTSIDYSFLRKYNNLKFVGVQSEYDDIKKYVPDIQWIKINNFRQLAQIIAGCKLFIGNQSFPFSIAEALKVPRILESYYHVSNVVPEGENGNDFFFQDHFEWLVEHLNKNQLFYL